MRPIKNPAHIATTRTSMLRLMAREKDNQRMFLNSFNEAIRYDIVFQVLHYFFTGATPLLYMIKKRRFCW